MEYLLTVSQSVIEQLVRQRNRGLPRTLICRAGICRTPQSLEWLLSDVDEKPDDDASPRAIVVYGDNAKSIGHLVGTQASQVSDVATVVLGLGVGEGAGGAIARCSIGGVAHSIDRLKVVGSQLNTLQSFSEPISTWHSNAEQEVTCSEISRRIWSRTAGAIGPKAWQRLVSLRFAIVGCGRTGSEFANSLFRIGARRLILIDPDGIELHNLGEMSAVQYADLGSAKVDALVRYFSGVTQGITGDCLPAANLYPVSESLLSIAGFSAAKRADIIICCVDNPEARLVAAFVSALYLRPLIDVGTGIVRRTSTLLGVDVRFLLPGHRCPLCLGGISGLTRTQDQRVGSLRSVNGLAVQFAMRTLEEYVAKRLRTSRWIQLNDSLSRPMTLRVHAAHNSSDCRVCQLAGLGDAGIERFQEIFAAIVRGD